MQWRIISEGSTLGGPAYHAGLGGAPRTNIVRMIPLWITAPPPPPSPPACSRWRPDPAQGAARVG